MKKWLEKIDKNEKEKFTLNYKCQKSIQINLHELIFLILLVSATNFIVGLVT